MEGTQNLDFKITGRLGVVLLIIFVMVGWNARTAQTQSAADKPVEQVRKNIQVLKGLPGFPVVPRNELCWRFTRR